MIDARDLRIGNLVLADVGLPSMQVHFMTAQDILDLSNGKTTDLIQPMPLTEDAYIIPLPAGNYGAKFDIKKCHYSATGNDFDYWRLTLVGHVHRLEVWVRYIHEVQNYYQLITEQEMPIDQITIK